MMEMMTKMLWVFVGIMSCAVDTVPMGSFDDLGHCGAVVVNEVQSVANLRFVSFVGAHMKPLMS